MTTARALAKVIVDEYQDSSMSLVLEVVRLVALEREHRAAKEKRKAILELETPSKIIAAVCAYYEVTERELQLSGRSRRYTLKPKHMAWLLLRTRLRRSYADIGNMFDRDHTTIITALRKFQPDPTALAAITQKLDETKAAAHAEYESNGEAAE